MRKRKWKSVVAAALSATLVCGNMGMISMAEQTASSGEWKKKGENLCYIDGTGQELLGIWKIGGSYYAFDENGLIKPERGNPEAAGKFVEVNGETYFIHYNGKLEGYETPWSGWLYGEDEEDNEAYWYYYRVKNDGTREYLRNTEIETGKVPKLYRLDERGHMYSGPYRNEDGRLKYFLCKADGSAAKNRWLYMNEDNSEDLEGWYYFNDKGFGERREDSPYGTVASVRLNNSEEDESITIPVGKTYKLPLSFTIEAPNAAEVDELSLPLEEELEKTLEEQAITETEPEEKEDNQLEFNPSVSDDSVIQDEDMIHQGEKGEQEETKESEDEDVAGEDIRDEDTIDKNAADEGTTDKDIVDEDTTDKDIIDEDTTDKDITDEDATDEDSKNDAAAGEDSKNDDAADENIKNDSALDEDIKDDGTTNEDIKNDSTTDEDIKNEGTANEDSKDEDDVSDDIKGNDNKDEDINEGETENSESPVIEGDQQKEKEDSEEEVVYSALSLKKDRSTYSIRTKESEEMLDEESEEQGENDGVYSGVKAYEVLQEAYDFGLYTETEEIGAYYRFLSIVQEDGTIEIESDTPGTATVYAEIDGVRSNEITVTFEGKNMNDNVSGKLEGLASVAPDFAKETISNMQNAASEEYSALKSSLLKENDAYKIINENYMFEHNIGETVKLSEELSGRFDEKKLNIIGAALNADEGEDITFEMSEAEETDLSGVEGIKKVPVDLSMYGGDGSKMSELEVPVVITVPIPDEISTFNLALYHIHEGQTDLVRDIKVNSSNRTLTFVTDQLSTFVFANKKQSSGGSSHSGGGGGGGGSSSGSPKSTANTGVQGSWQQDETGWWFKKDDGSYPVSEWIMTADTWYRFDEKGYMVTGWYTDVDGNKYYLNPISDGTLGAMKTGWQQIENKWYYFNLPGNGVQGALVTNGITPDGFRVDENGVYLK